MSRHNYIKISRVHATGSSCTQSKRKLFGVTPESWGRPGGGEAPMETDEMLVVNSLTSRFLPPAVVTCSQMV